jgi:hypothetical protein
LGSWRVLQLAWAVASKLAQTGACATLDVYAANWLSGAIVASLPPDRPFNLHREVSLIAETEPTPGFGHAVHTRGMMKVGWPDLIAGVPADRIEENRTDPQPPRPDAGRGPHPPAGWRLRFDGRRTVMVTHYAPDATTPDVNLNNDGLLIVDV